MSSPRAIYRNISRGSMKAPLGLHDGGLVPAFAGLKVSDFDLLHGLWEQPLQEEQATVSRNGHARQRAGNRVSQLDKKSFVRAFSSGV